MDFHTLSRKELQALCKKNKIPANITNVAMADSLAALPQVEGLDELLNPKEGDVGTPDIRPRTVSRTSTQRKARNEPESSKVTSRVRRVTAAGTGEGVVEQENKDNNVPATPAAVLPSSRRRAPAPSTRRTKKEAEMQEEDEDKGKPKTAVAAPRSRARATGLSACTKVETSGYSTRRSVRLIGKSLSKMSLMDTEDEGLSKIDDVSEELSGVSEHVEEDSSVTGKGGSLQTVSSVVSEKSDDLEVSSLNNTDYECRPQEEVSEKVNDLEPELQAEKQEEVSENVNDLEPELKAEKLEEVSENVNDMEAELQAEKQEEVSENVNDMDSNLKVDSTEAGSKLLSELKESCDSSALENKECVAVYDDALSVEVSQVTFMEVAGQDIAALTVVAPGDSCEDGVAGSLPMPSVDDASVSLKEFVEGNTDNEGNETEVEHSEVVASAGEHQEEELEAKLEYPEEDAVVAEKDGSSDVTGAFSEAETEEDVTDAPSAVVAEKVTSTESSKAVTVVCDESSAEEEESMEAVIEHPEDDIMAEIDSDVTEAPSAVAAEKDASSESPEAVIDVCNEPLADDKEGMKVEDVILQFSSLDVGENNAKNQEDSSEKMEAEDSVSEVIAIPEQEPHVSAEQIKEVSLNSVQPETKEVSNNMCNSNVMKENGDDLKNMSMRGLKKILKQKFAGPEEHGKSIIKVQEGEKKRTALQALQQN